MNDFIEALKEIKKESKDFKITLSKKEVLEITDEIDRLHSIIKEVREYIEKNYDDYEEFIYGKDFKEKILEILDKEVN